MALGLRKISQIISFPHFFSLCLQTFIWYLVDSFVIPIYRSSLSLRLIHWFFTKLWPLDLEYIRICCGPICATGRGLCIAMQYSQNACFHWYLLYQPNLKITRDLSWLLKKTISKHAGVLYPVLIYKGLVCSSWIKKIILSEGSLT